MTDYSELRAAAMSVPSGDWERTSDVDPHWKRAVSIGKSHSAIWSGLGRTVDAYSIIGYVVAANPSVVLSLLDELDTLRAQVKPAKPKKGDLPTDFELAYSAMKWRAGSTRAAAAKQWNARLTAGYPPDGIIDGANNYAAHCKATGREVMMAQTFLGPGLHFTADWSIPASAAKKAQGEKFHFDGMDRSGDQAAQAASMAKHGIVISDDEVKF